MHCLHVREVSVPKPVTAICVISSPFLISANISKPVLVNASTVSVIADVAMLSVNVTSVPVCRSFSKNQGKTFFYQPSTLLRRTVNVCKLRVHCHDVCNITPPPCISVNSVKILLNVIRFNVHKTAVSYKTVQSFCSDVVAQNVNVISSPTCKVLCFKKQHRVSPIKCFMLETSPFAVTPSTKLSSSSILLPLSSSLSSLSSSSISTSPLSSLSLSSSSSPLSLNQPLSSSSSVSLYISLTSEVLVSPSYFNSSVFFLTTCFLLFIGFNNILFTNNYIDLLLLALAFLKIFSTFNKKYSKCIMCYNFNCRLVLDLYILFQSFRAVLITQKLGLVLSTSFIASFHA